MEFYSNYFETGNSLPTVEEQNEFYGAIIRYLFLGTEPEFTTPYMSAVFQGVMPSLKKQRAGRVNKTKRKKEAKTKQTGSKAEAKQKEMVSNEEANDKELGSKTEGNGKKLRNEETNKLTSIVTPIVPTGDVIAYLNFRTGKNFKDSSKSTLRHINARFAEGYTIEDFKTVIDNMANRWLNDPKMEQYLRPETLFGTKFDGYLNMKPKGGANDPFGEYAEIF